MAKYIDKDTLLAKIERLKDDALQKKGQCKRHGLERIMHQISTYNKVLSLIGTFEVTEINSTDAFIEKAVEWIKESITNNPDCNRIISKKGVITMGLLIEDFKNYMKGE